MIRTTGQPRNVLTRVLVCVVVIALAALASAANASSTASGLRGKLMRGPTKPICKVGDPCEEPVKGAVLVFRQSGHVAARARTTPTGAYSVRLRPGLYHVRVSETPFANTLRPRTVRVPRGRIARVTFHLETNIQ